MKQRPLKMDAYGITFDEYKELYHFCQQYETKKRRLADMLTIRGSSPKTETLSDGSACVMPHGRGMTSDPVMDIVIRREALLRDIALVEQSAIEADPELYQYIIKAVTTRDGVAIVSPPCGRNQFLSARRRFFYILWGKRNR